MILLTEEQQNELMAKAQLLVDEAIDRGDGPFAALLIDSQGNIVASANNTSVTSKNVSAHAEINLLATAAAKLQTRDLSPYAVVVNAAPCSMCMSGLIKAKVQSLYYGAPMEESADPFITPEEVAAKSKLDIRIVSGIRADECKNQILRGRAKQAER